LQTIPLAGLLKTSTSVQVATIPSRLAHINTWWLNLITCRFLLVGQTIL